jgi:hypothetical protein
VAGKSLLISQTSGKGENTWSSPEKTPERFVISMVETIYGSSFSVIKSEDQVI